VGDSCIFEIRLVATTAINLISILDCHLLFGNPLSSWSLTISGLRDHSFEPRINQPNLQALMSIGCDAAEAVRLSTPRCCCRDKGAELRHRIATQCNVQAGTTYCWISTRFHPKMCASIDQPPGPSSTNATPKVAKKIHGQAFPLRIYRTQRARMTSRHPAIGVHKPTIRSTPSAIASMSRIAGSIGWPVRNLAIPCVIKAAPTTTRISKSPAPGQPRANVEYKRRKRTSSRGYPVGESHRNPRKSQILTHLSL